MSEDAPAKWLPKNVDPRKLVSAGAAFKREIRAEDMPRLQEVAASIVDVRVDVLFDRDEQGRPEVIGTVDGSLELTCQRCLESMALVFEQKFHLAIVWDEAQAKALPKYIDPWIVGEEEADLCAMIEEEILLSLPVVPKHDTACQDPAYFTDDTEQDVSEKKRETHNPFSVLKGLKKGS